MRWTLLALLALPGAAFAQARECRVPAIVPRAVVEGPTADQPTRQMAIGGYTLAITWSPQYCRSRLSSAADRFQCGGAGGPRFGFTLHGLWPDGVGKLWPQYCKPAGLVPERVVRDTLCATPDPQLIQHEYAKHATCMPGTTPARYFARSTTLYSAIRYPDMDALSRRPLTVARFTRAFADANPGMRPDMLKLNVNRQGWLEEVWLCLDTAFQRTACSPGGPRGSTKLRVWRGRS